MPKRNNRILFCSQARQGHIRFMANRTKSVCLISTITTFGQKKIQKTYLAITAGKAKNKQGSIVGDIARSRRGLWCLERTRHYPAGTAFFSTHLANKLRLYWVMSKTGKTYQIRVALKSNGTPIVGDMIYAKQQAYEFDRLYLHAHRLRFHWLGENIEVTVMPKTGSLCLTDVFAAQYQLLQNKLSSMIKNNKEI